MKLYTIYFSRFIHYYQLFDVVSVQLHQALSYCSNSVFTILFAFDFFAACIGCSNLVTD